MSIGTQARAEWRVLMSAALIGSGVGLALGAGYMAGGMADAAADHARAERIAMATAGAFSESVLHRNAAGMDAGVIAVARNHDPLAAPGPDRQVEMLAQGLDAKYADSLALQAKLTAAGARPRSGQEAMRELECLTQAVYFEARGETSRGQAAVAQVVLNRVKHPAFPKTVCGVVFQGSNRRTGCQFSFACDGSMRGRREASAWERSRKVAARALSGRLLGEVGSATHFHTTAVSPYWGPQMRRVAQVGMHVFYKFHPRGMRPVQTAPAIADHVMLAAHNGPAADELRLANAVVETAADAGQATAPEAPQPEAKPAAQPTQVSKAADVAPVAADASATTAS
ncbi:cell wall hydrolase [Phenylobacterium sp. J367]|uniref:cell wall hydrolase n=1 Tax=Phenylobacterium sp. J367 TaxID=2898435 RepID=UPI002150D04F|nr:cell wall hydrolase [Phenylobacterium sp. J367]MCR5877071.1 cell wall hydrolase [Phenylobacterium sp. J367]